MEKKDENSPANLWARRSNSSKLSLSMNKTDRNESHDSSTGKRFGSLTSKTNPFTSTPTSANAVASPTSNNASASFGLGSGAFASFGSATKTPKTPASGFDWGKAGGERKESQLSDREDKEKEVKRPPARKSLSSRRTPVEPTAPAAEKESSNSAWPLKHGWIIHYRPPTSKNSDYEKSMKPMCKITTAQAFWAVYTHLKHPSVLPTVSDYHFFKDGIRPVWEDEENKRGGKWTMRLKKGVADRYWEDLLLALIGDQFAEASEEVCGAVISVRSGEDVLSIWTKNDGGRNIKIRETIKRVLALPPDTSLQWRSHDESITQRNAVDQAKVAQGEKRRNTLNTSTSGVDG